MRKKILPEIESNTQWHGIISEERFTSIYWKVRKGSNKHYSDIFDVRLLSMKSDRLTYFIEISNSQVFQTKRQH